MLLKNVVIHVYLTRKHLSRYLWKAKDAKNKKYNYGVKVSKQWYWYENWIDVVRDYCQKNNF